MSAADTPALFPLFVDLRHRTVLVVGAGEVARRKVEALLEAGAHVRVGAPQVVDATLAGWVGDGRVTHLPGVFIERWLDEAWLVVAATGDHAVNRAVAAAAQARRIWANVVDDAALSAFQVPARVRRGPLQIAISSGGGAPMVARLVREDLEARYDDAYGALAALLDRHRTRIRARWPQTDVRRRAISELLDGPVHDLLRRRRTLAAERAFEAWLHGTAATHGAVHLVGAGAGDAGLLTLRGLRALNQADVILHDRLVDPGVLELARRDAERIDVGKLPGAHATTQARIHALMIEHARAGRRVVRLKGGDAFVFGRGGEELEALRDAGIDYEVVPGITAALACAAHAGVPLTHRDHAQSVRLITAHCRESLDTLDWAALARERQTLAVYMGVGLLETLQARLLAHGMAAATPFALIENGGRARQRTVVGTLRDLAQRANEHQVRAPALLILGSVAALATRLHWYGDAPLTEPLGAREAA